MTTSKTNFIAAKLMFYAGLAAAEKTDMECTAYALDSMTGMYNEMSEEVRRDFDMFIFTTAMKDGETAEAAFGIVQKIKALADTAKKERSEPKWDDLIRKLK